MTGAREVTTPDDRKLLVHTAGAVDGPSLVAHHGTPGAGGFYRTEVECAERLGLRLIAMDRPGYGGSSPQRGRSVADAATDVATVLDELGVETFATYGMSGGGPHALACAALLPERCAAAATLSGVGPPDAPDLDFLAGMGEGNQAEFAAARAGRDELTAYCAEEAEQILGVGSEDLAAAMRPHLSDVDAAALTGEVAAYLLEGMQRGLRDGVEGWVDDDYAFLAPWGFDVGAIMVPTLVWNGEQDLMVPADHGRWLREHVAGTEGRHSPEEGHLTLIFNRIPDVHGWLYDRLR